MSIAVVFGGCGALGRAVLAHLKTHSPGLNLVSVDVTANPDAAENYTPDSSPVDIVQGRQVKLVVNAAGGWQGNDAHHPQFEEIAEQLWRQNVRSSIAAVAVAAEAAKSGNRSRCLLVLVGAKAVAMHPCPDMLGYSMAKAAVHRLARDLAARPDSLAPCCEIILLLPEVLDTPANRLAMPSAKTADWTPPTAIAAKIHSWLLDEAANVNGTEWLIVTRSQETTWTPLKGN